MQRDHLAHQIIKTMLKLSLSTAFPKIVFSRQNRKLGPIVLHADESPINANSVTASPASLPIILGADRHISRLLWKSNIGKAWSK